MVHWRCTFDANMTEEDMQGISEYIIAELRRRLGDPPGQPPLIWNIGFENMDYADERERQRINKINRRTHGAPEGTLRSHGEG